ncbi:MAG: QueT transporter family protein [Oscillospiraceae bacterium]|nr:QueT transporter family protein [Oscillospiraceae bacterium]
MRNSSSLRRLCAGGVIAALYAVLTLVLPMLSYGPVQIRFAEALTILPFFLPEAIPGLAIGCFIANLIGSPYVLDWLFGTLATLLAALWTSRMKKSWLAPLPPVLCNTVIIGAEIAWFETGFSSAFPAAWAYNGLTVGIGELLACYILGMILLKLLPKISYFRQLIPENRLTLLSDK